MSPLEKTSQKITMALLASQSFFSAAFIISITVSSIIMVELAGGNNQWAGVPSTLMLVAAAAVAYPMGRLMDRFGRRPGLTVGYLIGITGMILAGMAVILQSLPLFLVGVIGLGLNRGANDLGRYAAAEAAPADKQARAISLVVLGGTVGSVGGPIIFQWVSDLAERIQIPLMSAPWFAAALFLAGSLLMINLFLRPEPRELAKLWLSDEVPLPLDQTRQRSKREIFSRPHTIIAAGAMIFGQLTMITVMTITPVYMYGHHHPLASVSWVIMAHAVGMFGLSVVTGWLVDKLGQIRMIVIGGLTMTAACLMAPLWDNVPWLALSLFLLGLGWNFGFVAGSALLNTVVRASEKGQVQGLTDTLVYFASGLGSISSGLIFAALGFMFMSWLSILAALLPVLLVVLYAPMGRKPATISLKS